LKAEGADPRQRYCAEVVVADWVVLHLNPHPLKAEGAAPDDRLKADILRTWGAAVLRPYMSTTDGVAVEFNAEILRFAQDDNL
jgi:hypothetical protein